jgi:hypothetical protein
LHFVFATQYGAKLERLRELIKRGQIRPVIDSVLPLTEVARRMKSCSRERCEVKSSSSPECRATDNRDLRGNSQLAQYETIKITHADGLMWISFNRPQVVNAFNLLQWRELQAALDEAAGDDAVRVVALRGEGGNFSAGYDLTAALGGDLAEPLPNAFRDYVDVGNAACWAVWNLKKPVISMIQGYCLGGAFELALACDFAYGDTSAELGEPEILLSDAPPFLISPWIMGMR